LQSAGPAQGFLHADEFAGAALGGSELSGDLANLMPGGEDGVTLCVDRLGFRMVDGKPQAAPRLQRGNELGCAEVRKGYWRHAIFLIWLFGRRGQGQTPYSKPTTACRRTGA